MTDPLPSVYGVYDEEQKEKLRERMHDPVVDSYTEWVQTDRGKRLLWTCGECGEEMYKEVRHGTIRCEGCLRILQAENYSTNPNSPDPENPDWFLEKLAKRRGLPPDEFKETPEEQSALSW